LQGTSFPVPLSQAAVPIRACERRGSFEKAIHAPAYFCNHRSPLRDLPLRSPLSSPLRDLPLRSPLRDLPLRSLLRDLPLRSPLRSPLRFPLRDLPLRSIKFSVRSSPIFAPLTCFSPDMSLPNEEPT